MQILSGLKNRIMQVLLPVNGFLSQTGKRSRAMSNKKTYFFSLLKIHQRLVIFPEALKVKILKIILKQNICLFLDSVNSTILRVAKATP